MDAVIGMNMELWDFMKRIVFWVKVEKWQQVFFKIQSQKIK